MEAMMEAMMVSVMEPVMVSVMEPVMVSVMVPRSGLVHLVRCGRDGDGLGLGCGRRHGRITRERRPTREEEERGQQDR
jgi:hypothetical protein